MRGNEGTQHHIWSNLRTWLALLLPALILAACNNNTVGPPPVDIEAGLESGSFSVTVTGDIISFVDFYLDDELSPFEHDVTAPYEATIDTTTLSAGDHVVKVVVVIDILNDESTVTRYFPFTVEATDPPPEPDPIPTPDPGTATLIVDTTPDGMNFYMNGPNSYISSFTGDSTIEALEPGLYTVTPNGDVNSRVSLSLNANEVTILELNDGGGEPAPDPEPTPEPEPTPVPEPTPEPTPDPEPEPDPVPPPPPPSGDSDVALVEKYWHNFTVGGRDQKQVTNIRYMPRQFSAGVDVNIERGPDVVEDTGSYEGWDVLALRDYGSFWPSTRSDLSVFFLNRSATVGVIWKSSNRASWLSGWNAGGTVRIDGGTYTVYERVFNPGIVELGGLESKASMYTVILAEADGTPTPTPGVPSGLEVPVANETCPGWVHDQYQSEGPDGLLYRTWHSQVDPVYWCYFGHEHGSDPELFGDGSVSPAFNYFFGKGGRDEPHEGHKVLTWEATGLDGHEYSYMHVVHGVMSDIGRACNRNHASLWFVYDLTTSELIAELYFKGDYGFSRVFDFDNRLGGGARKQYIIRPDACPENELLHASDTSGRRNLNVESGAYETWSFDSPGLIPLTGGLTIAFDNPELSCSSAGLTYDYPQYQPGWGMLPCNEGSYNGPTQDGTFRWFNTAAGETVGFGLNTTIAPVTGAFFTDYLGESILSAGDPNAVEQFVAAGHNAVFRQPCKWYVDDPWTAFYLNSCVELGEDILPRIDRDIEASIGSPN